MIPRTVTTFGVVPDGGFFQYVIKVCVGHDAERIEHFVFNRLNHAFDMSLQVRRSNRRFLDLAFVGREYTIKRLGRE